MVARLLGAVLKIDHSLNKDFKTIVISKYAGLGSIIQATPLIQTLRINYPNAELIFVSTCSNKALLKHIPELNSSICIEDRNVMTTLLSSFHLVKRLWKLKPDLFIDLEFYSNYSGIITTLSRATNRFGFYNEEKSYRKGIHTHLVPFNINKPISETYLQFGSLLNCQPIQHQLKLAASSVEIQQLEEKIGLNLRSKYMVINPNASDLRVERRWPKEYFIQSIQRIRKSSPEIKLVLIGNAQESYYVNEIVSEIADLSGILNTAGKLSLSELIQLISCAQLMLTNDTGPMHIAFALNTKTIALFGPCSPEQYGNSNHAIQFYKKVHCSPCVHKHLIPPCRGNNICMKNICVNEVCEAVAHSLTSLS